MVKYSDYLTAKFTPEQNYKLSQTEKGRELIRLNMEAINMRAPSKKFIINFFGIVFVVFFAVWLIGVVLFEMQKIKASGPAALAVMITSGLLQFWYEISIKRSKGYKELCSEFVDTCVGNSHEGIIVGHGVTE